MSRFVYRTPSRWPTLYKSREPSRDVIDLLQLVLSPTIALSGAACQGRPELFDADAKPEQHAEAIEICTTICPVADQCSEWARTHRFAVSGILAGSLHKGPHPKVRAL